MTIEILYFGDCPHYEPACARVREALRAENASADVSHVEVRDQATAAALGFLGSPTVRVNGVDVEASARAATSFGLCCRTYQGDGAHDGAPSIELIRAAIRHLNHTKGAAAVASSPRQPATDASRQRGRGTILASMAAVASAVAASSCCLPLIPFVAAAGLAGGSAFFATVRPYLLGASVLLIGFAFYQSHRAKQCNCRPSKVSTALLWFSAGVVAVMIFFPQVVAALIAG